MQALSANLNDARYEVARIMAKPFLMRATSLDYEDYMKGDSVDLKKVYDELFELSGLTDGTRPQEVVSAAMDKNGEKLVDLLEFLSLTHPYSERLHRAEKGNGWRTEEAERKTYDPKWHQNLIAMNQVLLINKKSIIAQIAEFEQKDSKDHAANYSSESALRYEESGFYRGPNQMATDFYNRIEFIQKNIIPRIDDNSLKLTFYQNRFRIKSCLIWVSVMALIIFFVGIFLPLLLSLIGISSTRVEFLLLTVTFIPYLCLLIWLLTTVAKWKIP